jgi:hypothetical protein
MVDADLRISGGNSPVRLKRKSGVKAAALRLHAAAVIVASIPNQETEPQ